MALAVVRVPTPSPHESLLTGTDCLIACRQELTVYCNVCTAFSSSPSILLAAWVVPSIVSTTGVRWRCKHPSASRSFVPGPEIPFSLSYRVNSKSFHRLRANQDMPVVHSLTHPLRVIFARRVASYGARNTRDIEGLGPVLTSLRWMYRRVGIGAALYKQTTSAPRLMVKPERTYMIATNYSVLFACTSDRNSDDSSL